MPSATPLPTALFFEHVELHHPESVGLIAPLLQSHPDLARASRPTDGRTGLMIASLNGNIAMVELLLPLSDPDAVDAKGKNALMLAAALEGDGAIVRLLTDATDLNALDHRGRSALLWAAQYHNAAMTTLLLHRAPHLLDQRDRTGTDAIDLVVNSFDPNFTRKRFETLDAFAAHCPIERIDETQDALEFLEISPAQATAQLPALHARWSGPHSGSI